MIKDISKDENLKLFKNYKIKDLLKLKLTYKKDENFNKNLLEELKKDKYKKIKNFLEYPVGKLYEIMLKENFKEELFNEFQIEKDEIDFKNLFGKIKENEEKNNKKNKLDLDENKNYLDNIETYLKDFKNKFEQKKGRKTKIEKKSWDEEL